MKIFFPGIKGSYAHSVCINHLPEYDPVESSSAENAFFSFVDDKEEGSMLLLPFENTIGGKVLDIHDLIFDFTDCFIVNEYYLLIEHCFAVANGVSFDKIRTVMSHLQALRQCSRFVEINEFSQIEKGSTAEAAKFVAENGTREPLAAICSLEAANLYGLDILKKNVQNSRNKNITRFICIKKDKRFPQYSPSEEYVTCILYNTKNVQSALFKSLLGFSTNRINVIKLESKIDFLNFGEAKFYLELLGHPENLDVKSSLEELRFFSSQMDIIGVYKRNYFW